jgi:ribosome assembly protein YihI (activator of Der GTPase)
MAQRKPAEKVTLDQVLKMVDQLTPEDQKELRQAFLEDEEDINVCLERLKKPKTISHEELKKQIGMAD